MARLHEVNIDKNRYDIKELNNKNYHTYELIDKKYGDRYYFHHIIGLEQINEDELLILDRYNEESLRIKRFNTKESSIEFEKVFNHFEFVNDDKILFMYYDNAARSRCDGIYSIKNNNYVEEAKWLNGEVIDIYTDEKSKEKIIYVEEELSSINLNFPKVIYSVNTNTFEPNGICYSELRDQFINIKSKEDILNIKIEDKKYIEIIESFFYKKHKNRMNEVKKKVLKNN